MKKLAQACVMAILCLHLNILLAQNNTITGTVRNGAGQPLAGATVTNTRTGRGTVTNAAGAFALHGAQPGDGLRISYIGYAAQTLVLGKNASLAITLKEATNELDRVVVQAYGTTTDRLRTGNIGKLTAADIEKQPVMNVLDALQGQIPGVVVSHNNGNASSSIKLEIRGRSTINYNQTSDPLYVVDGVPLTILSLTSNENYNNGSQGVLQSGITGPASGQSPFFNINPADIESVEVLKDADATAIYGSRGANGVLLITTKKGKAGKPKLDLSVYQGASDIPNSSFPRLLNTAQYVAMRKEALKNDGLPLNAQTAADLVIWDTTRYTDWQRQMWGGTGYTTDVNAAFSGGNAQTNFRLGAGFHAQRDILAVAGANQRGGLSLSLKHLSANGRFSLSLSSVYTATAVSLILNPNGVGLAPNAPAIYDAAGNPNYKGWEPYSGSFPFGYLLRPYQSETNLHNSALLFSYELAAGFSFKTNLGYNAIGNTQDDKTPIKSQDPARNPKATYVHGSSNIKNILVEPQLEWRRFVAKGLMTVLAGASYQRNKTDAGVASGSQIPNDVLMDNIASAPLKSATLSTAWYKYIAVFGRAGYNWGNRYLLNLNFRRDGSSRFGPGRQFGNFGSLGGAYIFTETAFFKSNLPFISFGKIRGSYGTTGGDQVGNYEFLTRWTFQDKQYNGVQILNPVKHTDSTFQWQVNKKLELAATLAFLANKLTLDVSWYRNRCNNQLIQFPLPYFTGFSSVLTNSPANVQNTGWEFALNAQLYNGKYFKYTGKFNIGINRNKLLSYSNINQSPYASSMVVGQPLNLAKVLHSTGVDPQTGEYVFEDRNGDGKVTIISNPIAAVDDRYFTTLNVKFDGGMSHTLSYKGLSLDLFFYFRKQLGRKAVFRTTTGGIGNASAEVMTRWQKPGDQSNIASFTTRTRLSDNYFAGSDGIYTDASFVRLQNLVLAYTLPAQFLKRMGLSDLRLNLSGRNLFVLTPYRGADPETQAVTAMPLPRTLTAGISLGF